MDSRTVGNQLFRNMWNNKYSCIIFRANWSMGLGQFPLFSDHTSPVMVKYAGVITSYRGCFATKYFISQCDWKYFLTSVMGCGSLNSIIEKLIKSLLYC